MKACPMNSSGSAGRGVRLVRSHEDLDADRCARAESESGGDLPPALVRFIGACNHRADRMMQWMTRIKPAITPLSRRARAPMILASLFHITRGEISALPFTGRFGRACGVRRLGQIRARPHRVIVPFSASNRSTARMPRKFIHPSVLLRDTRPEPEDRFVNTVPYRARQAAGVQGRSSGSRRVARDAPPGPDATTISGETMTVLAIEGSVVPGARPPRGSRRPAHVPNLAFLPDQTPPLSDCTYGLNLVPSSFAREWLLQPRRISARRLWTVCASEAQQRPGGARSGCVWP